MESYLGKLIPVLVWLPHRLWATAVPLLFPWARSSPAGALRLPCHHRCLHPYHSHHFLPCSYALLDQHQSRRDLCTPCYF